MRRPFSLSGFCSYSHKDDKLRERLETCLQSLRREGLIDIWNDRRIKPGDEWTGEINEHLRTADIVLLLVTANFVASDYCMDVELSCAMDRHERGEARVVPIIFRDCVWQNQQFGKIETLPKDGRPVIGHPRGTDYALREMTQGIGNMIREGWPDVSRPPLPDPRDTILAHLCNRKEQEIQLKTAWDKHAREKPERPFICIIHGGVEEDHSGYRNRLLTYSVPKAIRMPHGSEIKRYVSMKWPSDHQGRDAIVGGLSLNLAAVLGCSNDLSTMAGRLGRLGNPAVTCCELLSSYPNYGDREAAQAFCEFWSSWPDLSFSQALLVLLFIRYQPGNRRISAEDLFRDMDASAKISQVVLKELPPISNEDVKEWMAHPEVMRFCDVPNNLVAWQAAIDQTFLSRERIPMEQLVGSLNRMLADYQRRLSS